MIIQIQPETKTKTQKHVKLMIPGSRKMALENCYS